MFEDGIHVVVGEISPELLWDKDFISPYSDLVWVRYSDLVCVMYSFLEWGGEKVPLDMSCPVVDEIGEEEIIDESLQTDADIWGWGATSAMPEQYRIFNKVLVQHLELFILFSHSDKSRDELESRLCVCMYVSMYRCIWSR